MVASVLCFFNATVQTKPVSIRNKDERRTQRVKKEKWVAVSCVLLIPRRIQRNPRRSLQLNSWTSTQRLYILKAGTFGAEIIKRWCFFTLLLIKSLLHVGGSQMSCTLNWMRIKPSLKIPINQMCKMFSVYGQRRHKRPKTLGGHERLRRRHRRHHRRRTRARWVAD